MAKKNSEKTVEQSSSNNTVVNNMTNEVNNPKQVIDEAIKNPCSYGQKYSNFDEEKEPKIQAGLQTLLEMGMDRRVVALVKHWHDRPTWLRIRKAIAMDAAAAGMDQHEYEQEVLRKEVEKFEGIMPAVSAISYCFNYMKPRENATREAQQSVKVNGKIYSIGKKTLAALKEQFSGAELKEKILAVAKPINDAEIESF